MASGKLNEIKLFPLNIFNRRPIPIPIIKMIERKRRLYQSIRMYSISYMFCSICAFIHWTCVCGRGIQNDAPDRKNHIVDSYYSLSTSSRITMPIIIYLNSPYLPYPLIVCEETSAQKRYLSSITTHKWWWWWWLGAKMYELCGKSSWFIEAHFIERVYGKQRTFSK